MKTHLRSLLWGLIFLFQYSLIFAQTDENRLVVPLTDCAVGTTSQVAIEMTNAAEVVAAQFDMYIPTGVHIALTNTNDVKLTDRKNGHVLAVKDQGAGRYTLVITSGQNNAIRANKGELVTFQLVIDKEAEIDSRHSLKLSNIVLSDKSGRNVASERETSGILHLTTNDRPDITVKQITVTPTSLAPGDQVTIKWQVANIGQLPTKDAFKEQLYLVNPTTGDEYFLGEWTYSDRIANGATVSRSAIYTLKKQVGIDGTVFPKVKLRPYPDLGEFAADIANNEVMGSTSLTVAKTLELSMSTDLQEKETKAVSCLLYRSGSVKKAETFTLSNSNTKRLSVPSTVTIEKGEAAVRFTIQTINNETVDADSTALVTIKGNDYPEMKQLIWIADDEVPALTAQVDKETIVEGEQVILTVTRHENLTKNPLTVKLACDHSPRFTYPKEVVIPAGKVSTQVTLASVDNDQPNLTDEVVFTLSAPGYTGTNAFVTLKDNDIPDIELTIEPTILSESSGPQAAIATLKRTKVTNNQITVKLTDTAGGSLYYPSSSIVLEKGRTEYKFSIGVKDDSRKQGDRKVKLTAAVYVSSCSCSTAGTNAGTVEKELTLLDDDSESLKLTTSQSTLLEGKENATLLTITRNTSTDVPLQVTLACDKPDEVTFNASVTIPVGQSSVEVPVSVKKNDTTEGNRTITFTASADGFSKGVCWAMITDQTLPDATVSVVPTSRDLSTKGEVTVDLTVRNVGVAVLPAQTKVEVYLSNRSLLGSASDKTLLGTYYTQTAIAPNGEELIHKTAALPDNTGAYYVVATINAAQTVKELNYLNNDSEGVSVSLEPLYKVQLSTDKSTYKPGENIVITGQAHGGAIAGVPVDLYVIWEGQRSVMEVTTDQNGTFQKRFTPADYQIGHLSFGACYPGEGLKEEMSGVDVYGVRFAGASHSGIQVTENKSADCYFTLANPGNQALTNVKVELLTKPENGTITVKPVSTLAANSKTKIEFSVTGTAPSTGNDWEKFAIKVSSAEGIEYTYNGNFYCNAEKAILISNIKDIDVSISQNENRTIAFEIANRGVGETGTISVNIPNVEWMQLMTPVSMPSIKSGETAKIMLSFPNLIELPLNIMQQGNIGINCQNGDGIVIPFKILPVSETTGDLLIRVTDEYTYNTREEPLVEGAHIVIKRPYSNEVLSEVTTDDTGKYLFKDLRVGYYDIEVYSARHKNKHSNQIYIEPGKVKTEEAFLVYSAISITFDVEEIEVEDSYRIVTTTKFQTNVPKPVVVLDVPSYLPLDSLPAGETMLFYVTVTNHGLITAHDVCIDFPISNNCSFELMAEDSIDIAPQSSVQIPIKVTKGSLRSTNNNCVQEVIEKHSYICGDRIEEYQTVRMTTGRCHGPLPTCSSTSGVYIHGYHSWGGGSGSWGGWSGIIGFLNGASSLFTQTASSQDVGKKCTPGGKPIGSKMEGPAGPIPPDWSWGNDYNGSDDSQTEEPGNPGNPDNPDDSDDNEDDDCKKLNLKFRYEEGYFKSPSDYIRNHSIKGVVADGVSRMRIEVGNVPASATRFESVLSSSLSSVDYTGCLDNMSGSIESIYDSQKGAYCLYYTAPSEFPKNIQQEHSLNLEIFAYDMSGKLVGKGSKSISIIRVPVLMTHGLGDNQDCFKKLKPALIATGRYQDFQLLRSDYSETNAEYFTVNQNVVKQHLYYLFLNQIRNGYVVSKADLVGHSMGGILSRLHAQYVDKESVHRIITLNTPHSGSQGANLLMTNSAFQYLAFNLYHSLHAVDDLRVDSEATLSYLNNESSMRNLEGIPIHTITTIADLKGVDELFDLTMETRIIQMIVALVVIRAKGESSTINDLVGPLNYLYDGPSDLVVSEPSQKGGISANTRLIGTPVSYNHVSSPKNATVAQVVCDLLIERTDSEKYTKNGLNPPVLKYNDNIDYDNSDLLRSSLKAESALNENISVYLSLDEQSRKVDINLTSDAKLISSVTMLLFDDGNSVLVQGQEVEYTIPSNYEGTINAYTIAKAEGGELLCGEGSVEVKSSVSPVRIAFEKSMYYTFKDMVLQPKVTCYWSDGTESTVNPDFTSNNTIDIDKGTVIVRSEMQTNLLAHYKGLSCSTSLVPIDHLVLNTDENETQGVCASISLQFSQTMAMTRQAFKGTLTVMNGHESVAMKNVRLELEVKDEEGNMATSHEMQITPKELKTFTGELNGEWELAAQQTGSAIIEFIPTKYAAPTEPKVYTFGGTLTYLDPFTNLEVTRDLYPVAMTVNPSPNLKMTYFMQRDLLGDDPLTKEVEAVEPAEFSLLIHNVGAGDGTNIRMTTQQPKIVENEKGLAVEFNMFGSSLNGEDKVLPLSSDGSAYTEFGTIPAGQTSYAQWWFTSSLLGHFVDYDVKATHVTSYGNPDLSLLDTVTIKELIRSVKYPVEGTTLTGFLVNEIEDKDDLPDRIYLSDGTEEIVFVTDQATCSGSNTQYTLTVNPLRAGWNYGTINDPTGGNQNLISVRRASDGAEISLRNVWLTDRTLRDGKDPLYENRLHFVDRFATAGQQEYILTFEPRPATYLKVESIAGAPTETANEPVTELTVTFNKAIDPTTFTIEDLDLTCQGTKVDVAGIRILPVGEDHQVFKLDLTTVTQAKDGFFVLTVQTAEITDAERFKGKTGEQACWNQYIGGQVTLAFQVSPEEAGTVNQETGVFDHNASVALQATPATGYRFRNWTINGEVISTDATYTYTATGSKTLVANFDPLNYLITVKCDPAEGIMEKGATGSYPYKETVMLEAAPAAGYAFAGWKEDGKIISKNNPYMYTVLGESTIEAIFTPVNLSTTSVLQAGWNWVSVNVTGMQEPKEYLANVLEKVERFQSQTQELTKDPTLGLTGNLKELDPKISYKLKLSSSGTIEQQGSAIETDKTTISLRRGWNWLGYLPGQASTPNHVLKNLNASVNDEVKGQDGFAQFNGSSWIGTLQVMEPGKGYMYNAKQAVDFQYERVFAAAQSSSLRSAVIAPWSYDVHKYPSNMSVVAKVYDKLMVQEPEVFTIGAFVGKECRGIGQYVEGLLFLTVHGGSAGEKVTFKAYENQTGEIFDIEENLLLSESSVGNVSQPYSLHLQNYATGNEDVSSDLYAYPATVTRYLYVGGDYNQVDQVYVVSMSGQIVGVLTLNGSNRIDLSNLADGLYLIGLKTSKTIIYQKIRKASL